MSTILGYLDTFKHLRIVLASKSPARNEILKTMGCVDPIVIPSEFEENLDKSLFATPWEYAIATAIGKGVDVAKRIQIPYDIIIAADTIVYFNGEVIEKPKDSEDAIKMLQYLSGLKNEDLGRTHDVFTGVAIFTQNSVQPAKVFSTRTQVTFTALTEKDIKNYVATGEPLTKAGSYGVQNLGASLIETINGCFYNVQGLPLHDLSKCLVLLLKQGNS